MARIVTVYRLARQPFVPVDMSYVRWLKMSQALASHGHHVDIATNENGLWRRFFRVPMGPRLRRVPLQRVRWQDYDVVKTLFHLGFETLARYGGADHPFIISKLGSVVDRQDSDGVYFHGERRVRMFQAQEGIHAQSRYVTVLTEPSRRRWVSCFGDKGNTLLVPGGVDERIPARGRDPYPPGRMKRCLFAGNLYDHRSQPLANTRLTHSINRLGDLLMKRGIRLYVLGPGDASRIDARIASCLGPVPYRRSWDFIHYADVGIVLALGTEPNDNESTKIYHYLRAGLPTVCEAGFPNEGLIEDSQLGSVVKNGDLTQMAATIEATSQTQWERDRSVRYVLENHTWERRASIYDRLIREHVERA